jgi:serine/threonine protein kinase
LKNRHIVTFVGGFRQGSKSCLLFRWADGGNLRSYWSDENNWSRNGDLISWTIEQISGLFTALDEWHNKPSFTMSNGRHGDLKPENILRSLGPPRGIFQIADLGLAKVHLLPTAARNNPSSTPGGTLRYRPPEVDRLSDDNRIFSRSYDMWGMGCIILEWIIWLVYGTGGLDTFDRQAFPEEFDAFWSRKDGSRSINPDVLAWMKHMDNTCLVDGEQCYSAALRGLLLFVRDELLVQDSAAEQDPTDTYREPNGDDQLPLLSITPASDSRLLSCTSKRAKSADACTKLQEILSNQSHSPHYMFNPKVNMNGSNGRGPSAVGGLLTPFTKPNSRQEVKAPLGNR